MTIHKCPNRKCDATVPDSLFACRQCWYQLSPELRAEIYATARMPILEPRRRDVFKRAWSEWGGR